MYLNKFLFCDVNIFKLPQVPLVEFSIFWMILAFWMVQAALEEDDPSNLAHWVTVYLVISVLTPLLLIFCCTMYTVKF